MYTRIFVLRFSKDIVDQPIICKLVKEFDVEFNILKATIDLQNEGLLVLELRGHKANVEKGLAYLKEQNVVVERIAATIRRDIESCVQCGLCTGICPTSALALDRPTMEVLFDPDRCSGCGLCVSVCPVRAMAVSTNHSVNAMNK